MKATATTLLMGIIALLSVSVAWVYYPRIEVQETVVRETLLAEEDVFQPADVKSVKIESFDRNTNSPSELELKLEDGSWNIREHENYPANNVPLVAEAVTALRDKKVLEVVSDNKDDHESYGVLELSEMGNTGLGAGTVLTYEGRNDKPLAKLIVGRSPEGQPSQRFVRLAGQPQIYTVEFNPAILTTRFADWVDGKLVNVGGGQVPLPNLIEYVLVDMYYRDQDSEKKFNYRAKIGRSDDSGWVYDLWVPDDQKQIAAEPTQVAQAAREFTLANLLKQVLVMEIEDVIRKPQSAAVDLANPNETQPSTHFDPIKDRGFFHTGFSNGQHQFEAAAGSITIALRIGMEIHIYVGNMTGLGSAGGGKISRALMLTASYNPELFPMPKEEDFEAKAGEATDSGSAQDDEGDANRAYQLAIKEREEALEYTRQEVRAFNQLHADWIYEVPDESVSTLLPMADAWKNSGN